MTDLAALLREIAVPRRTGTPNHTRVREALKRELQARGFIVMEQRFTAAPRWPLWGVIPVECVNLIAVRPKARVVTWLAAHYDSKGQRLSMAGRLVLVAGMAVTLIAGVVATTMDGAAGGWLPFLALATGFFLWSRVTNDSPGAVDNASGVLTALAVLDALPAGAPAGILLLDAEEFGLQGARALVRERANLLANTAVINLDGIDDRARPTALVHRSGGVVDAVVKGTGASRWRRLPVVVDGIALAHAARECVTLMKGDWATMRVVHRPSDAAERLRLDGVRELGKGIATALENLDILPQPR